MDKEDEVGTREDKDVGEEGVEDPPGPVNHAVSHLGGHPCAVRHPPHPLHHACRV